MSQKSILITGAGLVGSLLAIYMNKRGYKVSVYEKREDPRKTLLEDGRSINLALSHRGIHALQKAGLEKIILENAIPMKGRMVHDVKGQTNFQPYGEEGQYINSVSRGGLNRALIEHASQQKGIEFHFNQKCIDVDIKNKIATFENYVSGEDVKVSYSVIAGSDGAFSQVRKAMQEEANFQTTIDKLPQGYKELHFSAGENNQYLIEKNALHIWPRGQFMLIALPNNDGSFTCTLFLPFEGENSFASIKNKKDLYTFFDKFFPDALSLVETIEDDYFDTEASFLSMIHTFPWVYRETAFLIGDAAHAIVPFYGQGMNAGLEDVRILSELLELWNDDWEKTLPEYQKARKSNTDAIAELSMRNFIEMRDLVADESFVLRKKIESAIHKKYKNYLPLYSMVTFSDLPYSEALAKGKEHDHLMSEILALPEIKENWDKESGWIAIEKIFLKNEK
ncbi:MAG TPA: NAD(P)/FAD-dependent oxidoreductase [Cytophagaceae bacterium]|nr:NAD(P)/FAD-dependent oxidoreductase [Cytophagaceae bacterium]